MKLKIALLFTPLLLFRFAQAQVSKDSYEKAVDLLNCKTVELSLSESPQKGGTKQPQNSCKCQDDPNFDQIKSSIPTSMSKTTDLSTEIESLKESFEEDWEKDEVVTFLSEKVFSDNEKYKKIFDFAEKREKGTKFKEYKENLKIDLSNMLTENVTETNDIAPTNAPISQSTIENRIAKLEKNQNKSDKSGFLGDIADYLIIYAILLGIIALFVGLRKQSAKPNNGAFKGKSTKNQEVNSQSQLPNNSVDSNINSRVQDLESKINKIAKMLSKREEDKKWYQEEIEEIKKQLSTLDSALSKTRSAYQEEASTFFLSTPNSDGSFNESSASSTYKEGATIYRFTKIRSNEAKFQIDENDASSKLALQFPDRSIDPVCDAINAFNPKATRITTVERGEARLETNKWLLIKKAKIKYEN